MIRNGSNRWYLMGPDLANHWIEYRAVPPGPDMVPPSVFPHGYPTFQSAKRCLIQLLQDDVAHAKDQLRAARALKRSDVLKQARLRTD